MKGPKQFRANASGNVRQETLYGRPHLVVPVVMLRETVVNGAFVPTEELDAAGWNGVPVTVNHPEIRGQTVTANSPATLEKWSCGLIFNARLDGEKLKAEAWVDIDKAEKIRPGIVGQLSNGSAMDVSTGYFPTAIPENGVYNGRAFTEVHTDLKPDHLALLPDDPGACSWQDGCGVRANRKRGKTMAKPATQRGLAPQRGLTALLSSLMGSAAVRELATNERSPDDNRIQIVADLIAAESSPFTADDMDGLLWLSDAVLQALRETYLEGGGEGEEPALTEEEETASEDIREEVVEANRRIKANRIKANQKKGRAPMRVNSPKSQGCDCGGHAAPAPAANRRAAGSVADLSPTAFATLIGNAVASGLRANEDAAQVDEIIRRILEDPDNVFTEEDLRAMSLDALEKLLARANEAAGEDAALGEEEREELEANRRQRVRPRVNYSGRSTGAPGGQKKFATMSGKGQPAK